MPLQPPYDRFFQAVKDLLPSDRYFTDPLRTYCWGTDASFYRYTPKIVLFPEKESQVSALLEAANKMNIPVTFRAAGTSLSGQSVSDSVLMVVGKGWEDCKVEGDTVTAQPGLVGGRLNEILAKSGRRFPPDPASINSAMLGGIIVNNASGMNCGVHANSDRVLQSARIVFADGTVLDTGDEQSREAFSRTHGDFIQRLMALREEVLASEELSALIKRKYSIKNVMGLNLLPLLRFDDPFKIIAHLMVGSEGTLAFLSRATLTTEKILPHSASAMVYFPSLKAACQAVQALKDAPAASTEMLDRPALRSVEGRPGMPDYLADLPDDATALLLETRSNTPEQLAEQIEAIKAALAGFETLFPIEFTTDPAVSSVWWGIRSGLLPSVGGMRAPGTTCLIEDVAFPLDVLPEATMELQEIIHRYGYSDGVIYGHAKDGNFHVILSQRFDQQDQVERYANLMREIAALVADKYHGSLKAEHGTGRNMAPFVEREWGAEAFALMKKIKALFDPNGILNPGVIFNDDPDCFIKNAKQVPVINEHIDRCMECGFCEVRCVTAGLTLSSRQRIAAVRQMALMDKSGDQPETLREMKKLFRSLGEATCAGDGLCSTCCPLSINTGDLTHDLRAEYARPGSLKYRFSDLCANHLGLIETALRPVLWVADLGHTILGTRLMSAICRGLHRLGVPLWTAAMPRAHKVGVRATHEDCNAVRCKHCAEHARCHAAQGEAAGAAAAARKVVYFPSCINQTFGTAKGDPDPRPLTEAMIALLAKAGWEVVFPKNMSRYCCGTIWESKGMPDIADRKTRELEDALFDASLEGTYPVLCDQSPCLYRMREKITKMKLYEPVEFIETFLVDSLDFHPIDEPVAVHTTCSMTKMGLLPVLRRLAERCSTRVFLPEEVGCCAFAGDKGFTHPEVNTWALRKLRPQLEENNIKLGFSNSRTCEIGLTTNSGIPYQSIVYLVDRVTTPKR